MITIKTKSEAEKRVIELFFEKIKLDAQIQEVKRSLGYSRRDYYLERLRLLEDRLERVVSLLSGESIEVEAPKEIEQYFVTIIG